MKILYPESNWASNIGNPFFYLGIAHAIRSAVPSAQIIETASNPILPFKLPSTLIKNSFNYPAYGSDADAVLFTGPMFDRNFRQLFEPAFRAAKERGQKLFLMSAGSIEYDPEEISHCREVLKEYTPDILMTRDAETFQIYGDLAKKSYNGICGAWFAPDYYQGYDTPDLGLYITSCFDFRKEPNASFILNAAVNAPEALADLPNVGKIEGRIGRVAARGLPDGIGAFRIIRPCHRPTNHPRTIFTQPNTFASYTPFGYLNLYRNTQMTITDRLHAAVVTIAYGNPAYLFLRSNRSLLLDRVAIAYQPGARLMVDKDMLSAEKLAQVSFLKNALSDL